MNTIWVVVADEGRARFLALPSHGAQLQPIDELTDAGAHASNAALSRDAHGRRGGDDLRMGGNATTSAGDSQLEKEAELFARRVADHLTQARRVSRYEQLHVVAAPKFLGRLRKALSAEVASCVVQTQDKDLIHLNPRELTERLFPSPARDATV
ncbi:MAG: host attachment protein [Methylibium sp.]|uniref:host attachment protein n=1 Tax=Methylibium sp. TaxID=2067992 RepID=UPI00179B4D81|nr:host attachment protein [Methylibium sp.]MBA3596921.1 host attachment protein [Methylibium sp.]